MLCIFNTFTSKYFHFAHVILTMLSSTYHFWGVHNLYQAKSAKLNIGEQSKVGLFFFFLFSLFVFYLSFFVIRFSLFVIRFLYSFFTFGLSPFVSAFRFSLFVFHFFDIQNRPSIVFWHSNWGRIYYFYIQNPLLTFKLGPNIEFWYSKSYFEIQNQAENRILTFKILFWHSNRGWISYFDILKNVIFLKVCNWAAEGVRMTLEITSWSICRKIWDPRDPRICSKTVWLATESTSGPTKMPVRLAMLMRKGIDIYFSCSALIYMKSVIINCMTNIAFIPQFKINFISLSKIAF